MPSQRSPSSRRTPLRDAGGVIALERESRAIARGVHPRARLIEAYVSYVPYDPFEEAPVPRETQAYSFDEEVIGRVDSDWHTAAGCWSV